MKYLVTLLVVLATVFISTSPVNAAAKKYPNCAALHVKYPNGVAQNQAAIDMAVGLNGTPTINKKLYLKNYKNLDRDRDGIACEV